jgi:hypothetical protein
MNKKGQLTLFVIFGVVIILIIILFVVFFPSGSKDIDEKIAKTLEEKTPFQEVFQQCLEREIENIMPIIQENAGYIYEKTPFIVYKFENIPLLCNSVNKDMPCTNLEPLLIKRVENEIEQNITNKIDSCFERAEKSYPTYEIESEQKTFSLEILPGSLKWNIERPTTITNPSSSEFIEDFSFKQNSPLYSLLRIALENINREATCNCGQENCNSRYFEIDKDYPAFTTTRYSGNNGEKAYEIEYLITGEKFKFGVKNCYR